MGLKIAKAIQVKLWLEVQAHVFFSRVGITGQESNLERPNENISVKMSVQCAVAIKKKGKSVLGIIWKKIEVKLTKVKL